MLVLAAGAGSRFSAASTQEGSPTKLLARLNGRPVLQHVLDRVAGSRPACTVVVLGEAAEAIGSTIRWRLERRVRNPHPEEGLSSSVRVGLQALDGPSDSRIRAALIVLGDQPRVRLAVMKRLLAAADEGLRTPFVAPRYAAGDGTNPLLIRREAWPLAGELTGDRGFGPLLSARPELVHFVDVPGANPDVDTPGDLADLAELSPA